VAPIASVSRYGEIAEKPPPGSNVPTALLALAGVVPLVIAAAGLAVALLNVSFSYEQQLTRLTALNAALVDYQLDEETGIRGYIATRRPILLQPYYEARLRFAPAMRELKRQSAVTGIGKTEYVNTMEANHALWLRLVAEPSLRNAHIDPLVELHGKTLVDRFRDASAQLAIAVNRQRERNDTRTTTEIIALGAGVLALIVLTSLLVANFSKDRRRLIRTIESETVCRDSAIEPDKSTPERPRNRSWHCISFSVRRHAGRWRLLRRATARRTNRIRFDR
jgi:CHASE3 domain sensor protein